MNTRANGDVLYLQYSSNKKSKYYKTIREAPQISQYCMYRGHSHWLLGSMTVESSFSVPVFFLVVMSLFYVFQIVFGINSTQYQMSEAVRNYATYHTKLGSLSTLLSDSKLIVWDEEKKICHVEYREKVPVLGSKFFSVKLYQQMRISDYNGKSMLDDKTENTADIYVYIAENGRVYHRDSSCTYLNPSVISCFLNQVEKKRNSSGAKYYPCEDCCNSHDMSLSERVYITTYGNRYHKDNNCSGLKRTVRRVKLKDIAGMPPCSKCGNRLGGDQNGD